MTRPHLSVVRTAPAATPPQPPSAKPEKYSFFVKTIHTMWNASGESEVKVLATIRDFERATVCWKTTPRMTFEQVLRDEKLCPISRYKAFKKASEVMGPATIRHLGLDAVCLIAKQPQKFWPKLISKATDHRKKSGHQPNTQQMSRIVSEIVPRQTGKLTYSQLSRHNDALREMLRENDLKVPRAPAAAAKREE